MASLHSNTHNTTNLFKPTVGEAGLAVLVLVENSQAMSAIWTDLYDRYLGPVLDKIEAQNPAAPILSYVLQTCMPQAHPETSIPHQCDTLRGGLRGLVFNSEIHNRITTKTLSHSIEFLAATSLDDKPVSKHLIIITASPPADESGTYPDTPLWNQIPYRLAAAAINCHLILRSREGMGRFTTLFNQTLHLQENIEEPLWFPVNHSQAVIRLSAKPPLSAYNLMKQGHSADPVVTNLNVPPSRHPPSGPAMVRPSHPHEAAGLRAGSDQSFEEEPETTPDLVTQLQIIHGLTKKKIYGSKPTREPFLRDERITENDRKSLLALLPPLPSYSLDSNAGGRVASQSLTERAGRVTSRRRNPRSSSRRSVHPQSGVNPGPLPVRVNEYPPSFPSTSQTSPVSSSLPQPPPEIQDRSLHPSRTGPTGSVVPGNPYPGTQPVLPPTSKTGPHSQYEYPYPALTTSPTSTTLSSPEPESSLDSGQASPISPVGAFPPGHYPPSQTVTYPYASTLTVSPTMSINQPGRVPYVPNTQSYPRPVYPPPPPPPNEGYADESGRVPRTTSSSSLTGWAG